MVRIPYLVWGLLQYREDKERKKKRTRTRKRKRKNAPLLWVWFDERSSCYQNAHSLLPSSPQITLKFLRPFLLLMHWRHTVENISLLYIVHTWAHILFSSHILEILWKPQKLHLLPNSSCSSPLLMCSMYFILLYVSYRSPKSLIPTVCYFILKSPCLFLINSSLLITPDSDHILESLILKYKDE